MHIYVLQMHIVFGSTVYIYIYTNKQAHMQSESVCVRGGGVRGYVRIYIYIYIYIYMLCESKKKTLEINSVIDTVTP